MIRITNENGSPLRSFPVEDGAQTVHFLDRYGFVGEESLKNRVSQRKAAGAYVPAEDSKFTFRLKFINGDVDVMGLKNCHSNQEGGRTRLETDAGIYFIENVAPINQLTVPKEPVLRVDRRIFATLALALILILIVVGVNMLPEPKEEEKVAEVVEAAPVILKPMDAVKAPVKDRIPPDPKLKSRKVVAKQLGFLGLLGRKDFKKAVGGLPTPAAQTSPGAGPGGTEGSGGELVAGMGKGLHQTTIGSTGMAGLGGVGTKGVGGGQGGYGDTAFGGVGSGVLSAVPLASEAKVDEGLDRAQIQATIMRYLSQVRACYEEGLKRNQALIGQVTMNFEVNGTGMLNYSRVQRSSLNDRPVEDCISQKMMTWKFPEPRGGGNVKVSYPFMLRPVKG